MTAITEIFLIRHGETAWNVERRLQGHLDIALNNKGEQQAKALGVRLKNEHFDAIIASDLQRATKTGQAIAEKQDVQLTIDAGLRERCYGAFEGLTYAEIDARYPVAYAAWQARQLDALMPAGIRAAENFNQFYRRSLTTIVRWAQHYQGQKIALVTHGGVLECAYRSALSMPLDTPRDFVILNAGINRFTFKDEKLVLVSWGETAHLDSLALDEVDLPMP